MSLAPLVLDDLGFDEMVASVRGRIPAASAGRWTLHAATDPGITLLELFAWLIEQRLYWLDQVPDELARALLALLGEAPRPPRPAATVLALQGAAWQAVAGEVPFRLLDPDRPRSFTTRQALTLLPVARVGLLTAAGDRSAPLAYGAGVPLLPAGGGPAEATIVLWLAAPLPSPRPPGRISLLFELAAPPGVEPEWSPGAVAGVRPPAEITWLHGTGPGGSPAPFPAAAPAEVEDGTGGLRRSGLLRLPLPDAWLPGPPAPDGALPYTLTLRTDAATFTSPPLLLRLAANAVAAEHSKAVAVAPAELAAAALRWLKLPGQILPLPADAPPPLPSTVALRLRERDGWREWSPVEGFAFHGPEARVFHVDRAAAALRFGDGLTGRIPVPRDPAAPEVEVRYRGGGGPDGNLGAGRDWEPEPAGLTLAASNPVPAAGGEEAETVAAAAGRLAAGLVGGERAVLAADYEELARTTPGVAIARAHAAIGHHPLHPCALVPGAVTVFVVPWAPRPGAQEWNDLTADLVRGPVTDPGALAAVAARLEERRLAGMEVFVRTARYRRVALAVTIAADPIDAAGLEARVSGSLARYLDPLAGGGGEGWPFGDPVRPSALVRRAQQAVGREGEVLAVAIGLDGQEPGEDCRDVAIGPFELVYLERIRVRWERSAAAAGGLP